MQILRNASSVRGPRYSIKKGKTSVLTAQDARKLLDSFDTSHVVGLRDRALIALMVYSFARVSAVVGMKVKDYYAKGKTLLDKASRERRKVSRGPGPSQRRAIS